MRPIALLLALLLSGCASPAGLSSGADSDPGPPARLTDRPRLLFTADGHDFGRMEKRERSTHTAVFYNGGRETLEVTEIRTHCGCAAALVSDRRVGPGERGTIRITLSAGLVPGKRTKTMEVRTNDPEEPVARYVLRFEVVGDAKLDPGLLVVRGTRAAGPVTSSFDVVSLREGLDLQVTGVRTSHEAIRTRVERLPDRDGRAVHRVHLDLGEGLGDGNFHERITVSTNSPRDRRLVLDVMGSVSETVLVVPERLYFPASGPGRSATRSVFVHREDGRPLSVRSATDPANALEAEAVRVGPSRWEVRVRISGGLPGEAVRGAIVIETGATRLGVPYEIAEAAR